MPELKWPVKWILFFSSYFPLMLIFAFRFWSKSFWLLGPVSVGQAFLIAGLVSIGILFGILKGYKRRYEPEFIDGESIEFRNDMISEYVLFYIYPFIALNYSEGWGWFSVALLFLVIGVLHVRSNNLFVNPVLAAFGYDVVEVKQNNSSSSFVVTQNAGSVDIKSLKGISLSDRFYLEAVNDGKQD